MSGPLIIGLTGGIAMGKSNLSAALQNAGAFVLDADAISHYLTAPGGAALPFIRAAFGDGAFIGAALDRKALGEIIFGDAAKREELNAILHPMVRAELVRGIKRAERVRAPIVILDAPLLFEAGLEALCDEVWCAYLPQEEQIKRLTARDQITRAEAKRRIQSQMPAKERNRRAAKVIRTDGSREMSASIVLSLYEQRLQDIVAQKEKHS